MGHTSLQTGENEGRFAAGTCISVVTGSGLPGHPGHFLSGSSGSDPLRNLSGSDPDWITCEIIN